MHMYRLPKIEVFFQPYVLTPTAHEEFSPTQRERRAALPPNSPPVHVESFPSSHVLTVHLPKYINPEMVTISVLKGHKLRIVADAWHMEKDCKCFFLL